MFYKKGRKSHHSFFRALSLSLSLPISLRKRGLPPAGRMGMTCLLPASSLGGGLGLSSDRLVVRASPLFWGLRYWALLAALALLARTRGWRGSAGDAGDASSTPKLSIETVSAKRARRFSSDVVGNPGLPRDTVSLRLAIYK